MELPVFSNNFGIEIEGYALGEPSCYYLDIIREGYGAACFDENILDAAVELSAVRKK